MAYRSFEVTPIGGSMGRRGGRRALMESTRFQAANVGRAGEMEAGHPPVRTHPETGRKGLCVSGSHLCRIAGGDRPH